MKMQLPRFFQVRQSFERPRCEDLRKRIGEQFGRLPQQDLNGKKIAVAVGSRGIAKLPEIVRYCVGELKNRGALPFIVPAMGSHGGATAEGQFQVLEKLGVNENSAGCPIRSSMETVEVGVAREGFPVHFDHLASEADGVLIINRIKPHTRFAGEIESGLMKMLLIGLGKHAGALVYHRACITYSFDQIVRSVANEVIQRCNILGGVAILENAYEETADVVIVPADEIEATEPELLRIVKAMMPSLPMRHCDLLIVDEIGKDISGTGMDTNVIGRKKNDHAAIEGELPDIHHIYVRALTNASAGNGTGIGIAEMCHRRVLEQIDLEKTKTNCITASHLTGAMIPIAFDSDREAIQVACQASGWKEPHEINAMWIRNTLQLEKLWCSEAFWEKTQNRDGIEVLSEPQELQFDVNGDFIVG